MTTDLAQGASRQGCSSPCRSGSAARALPLPAALAAVCLLAGHARADIGTASTGELKQLSVEELMNIEVTSVTRHPEKLLQAASAIQVITRDDIRRSGATSIPEALRLADNLEVAQKNSHDWAISARGFNTALANKLLVMIDGRTVYTPLYSGVFWDAQDYLLEDIDRIEVISGPGGTLWGANAVNGVINIITRAAADTHGLYAEAGGGNQLDEFGGARYGGSLAQSVDFRVYGKYFDRDAEVFPSGSRAPDAWHQGRGGFRVDSNPSPLDSLSVHGDFYAGHEGVDAGTVQTSGGNLVGHWTHVVSDRSDLTLQSYYDRTHLLDPIPAFLLGAVEVAPGGILRDDLTTFDTDFQHRFALGGRNHMVWGLGYRFTHDVVRNAPSGGFLPVVLDQNRFSAFLQDEILLGSDWSAIIGSKVEHNDYTGFEVEPNVRLEWGFAPGQAVWSAISRAARTPSRIDRDLVEPVPPAPLLALRGGTDFGSEYVTAYELGYRGGLGPRVTGSISAFYNVYDDVRSVSITPGTILPFYFANNLEGKTYGVELSGGCQVFESWSLHAGYDLLEETLHVRPGQFDLNAALNETADPRHQLSIRSTLDLPWHVDFDAALRWVDTLVTNSGPTPGTVPSYFELNSRLAWHAGKGLELSIVGQNLLHDHHPEYGFPSPTRVEIQRSVYGKVAWRY